MKIVAYHSDEFQPWATMWIDAFVKGAARHGIVVRKCHPRDYELCDIAVLWAHGQMGIIENQRKYEKDYIILERGYFGDREKWTSIGFNGLNGRADFRNGDVGDDRWFPHRHLMKPWKERGDYVLLIGQVLGDPSIMHLNFCSLMQDAANLIRGNRKVVYRPHPRSFETWRPKGIQVSELALWEILEKTYCTVTVNSNVGIDSVLAGVPTIALDEGSMVWPVAGHHLRDVFNPPRPDREKWAHRLAYCQWREDEIKEGMAWDHLFN